MTFFLLVFLLSIPFWVIGPVVEQLRPEGLPINLPISSLMAFAPVVAAVVLVRREEGADAVKRLLRGTFDHKTKLMGVALPEPRVPVLMVPVSFVVFFIAAAAEEVGWQGYAIDRLLPFVLAVAAGIVTCLWGPKTLAHYRSARPISEVQETVPNWLASEAGVCPGRSSARLPGGEVQRQSHS